MEPDFSKASDEMIRGNREVRAKWIPITHKEKYIHNENAYALEQARLPGEVTETQNSKQPVTRPCFEHGSGLDYFWRSLPTCIILQLH